MKEYDYVRVKVEKEKYAKEGVHKGMEGTILDPRCIEESWLVFFADETGADTIGIPIKEKDLEIVKEYVPKDIHVEIIKDSEELSALGLRKGMRGIITTPRLDENGWIVHFQNKDDSVEKLISIKREFLKSIE